MGGRTRTPDVIFDCGYNRKRRLKYILLEVQEVIVTAENLLLDLITYILHGNFNLNRFELGHSIFRQR